MSLAGFSLVPYYRFPLPQNYLECEKLFENYDRSRIKFVTCKSCGEEFPPSAKAIEKFGTESPYQGWLCVACLKIRYPDDPARKELVKK